MKRLNILWLTVDRAHRVANIFGPLLKAVQKIASVTLVTRNDWTRETIMGTDTNPRILPQNIVEAHDVLFTDAVFGYMSEDWHAVNIPKIALIEDCHGPLVERYVKKAFFDFGFDAFAVRYWHAFNEFFGDMFLDPGGCERFPLPHSIDAAVVRDYGQKKKGVLLTGRTTENVYPVRHAALMQMSQWEAFRHVSRPEEGTNDWPQGVEYYKLLNSAELALACSSVYHYGLLKIMEIPGCKTCLVTDECPEMYELGFLPWVHYAPIDGQNAFSVAQWLKAEPKLAHKVAVAGHNMVHRKHTAAVRAEELVVAMHGLVERKVAA